MLIYPHELTCVGVSFSEVIKSNENTFEYTLALVDVINSRQRINFLRFRLKIMCAKEKLICTLERQIKVHMRKAPPPPFCSHGGRNTSRTGEGEHKFFFLTSIFSTIFLLKCLQVQLIW